MKPIMRQALGLVLMLGMAIAPAPLRAEEQCIAGSYALPLLGGAGDAPLLPATMEGKPVALYFSTTVDRFYAGDVAAYGGKDTGETAEIIVNGKGSVSRPILRTGSLRLGEIDMGKTDMIRLDRFPVAAAQPHNPACLVLMRQFSH